MKTKSWIPNAATIFAMALVLLSWNAGIKEAKASPPSESPSCTTAPIPGGGIITFSSTRDGDSDIYIMEGDECHILQLTNDDASNTTPSWSPDNSKLLFSSRAASASQFDFKIQVMNADGTNRKQLVSSAPGVVQNVPYWSPNDDLIVFQIDYKTAQGHEIFVVNTDGTNLQQLTNNYGRDNHSPIWTPDGSQILFTSRRDPGNDGEAWLMNPDGTNQHMIMPDNGWHDSPFAMSPDSTKIAFASLRDGNWEIYVMDADGSNQTRLTNDPGLDTWPRWSPDGTRISFQSDRDGNQEIYVMYADGSNETRVTNNPADDTYAIWQGPSINQPPSVNVGGPYSGDEGSAVPLNRASASDPDGDPLTFTWSVNSSACTFSNSTILNPDLTCDDNGSYIATLTVNDGVNDPVSVPADVTVNNVAPTVGDVSAPVDPVSVNTEIDTSANFTDPGVLDTHTAVWDWGDGSTSAGSVNETNGSGSVSGSHTYTTPGVYTVKLTVTDKDGDSDEAEFQFVVVYDPDAGFVTGGGWIDSLEGAYTPDSSLTGKATFGFVSKYKKGANLPTGQTEFQFQVANLNFHSSSYDWLAVAGPKGMFKGIGTINGTGNFGFMVSAIDEKLTPSTDVDLFRIKIWDKDNGDTVIYDNQMGADDDADPTTAIGGGSIVIHNK